MHQLIQKHDYNVEDGPTIVHKTEDLVMQIVLFLLVNGLMMRGPKNCINFNNVVNNHRPVRLK